jgi:methylphosphotriester-DNA--protein-cysteine methyltransferase
MNLLFWAEKNPKITRPLYCPDFVNIAIFKDPEKPNRVEYNVTVPEYTQDEIWKAMKPEINQISKNQGGNIYFSDKEIFNLMAKYIESNKLRVQRLFIMKSDKYLEVTKGIFDPSTHIRRTRLQRALKFLSDGFDEVDINGNIISNITESKQEKEDKQTEEIKEEITENTNKELENTEEYPVNVADIVTIPDGYTFVLNKNTGVYHRYTCRGVTRMSKLDGSMSFITAAEAVNYKPCSICGSGQLEEIKPIDKTVNKQKLEEIMNKHDHIEDIQEVKEDTKDDKDIKQISKNKYTATEIMAKNIERICERFMVVCHIKDTTAVIYTAAGGWKFDFAVRPISLFHQNYKKTDESNDNENYHLENDNIYDPVSVIAYIIKHDNNRINTLLDELT